MNETIEKISDLIVRSGKKQKNLMEHLNVSPNLFTEWKAGRNKSYKKYLPQIAEYFGVSVDYLLGKETTPSADPSRAEDHQEGLETGSKLIIQIPIYERLGRFEFIEASGVHTKPSETQKPNLLFSVNSVAAIPFDSICEEMEYEEYRAEPSEEHMYAAIRLHDDSMAPRMMPGDVVIVKEQKILNDGDVAVLCPGDVAICRKIKKTPEGGVLLLAANQAYEPIFCSDAALSSGEIRVIGVVAELRAKFGID